MSRKNRKQRDRIRAEPSVAEVFSKDGYVKGFPGAGAFIKDNMDGTVTGNVEFPCVAGVKEASVKTSFTSAVGPPDKETYSKQASERRRL